MGRAAWGKYRWSYLGDDSVTCVNAVNACVFPLYVLSGWFWAEATRGMSKIDLLGSFVGMVACEISIAYLLSALIC